MRSELTSSVQRVFGIPVQFTASRFDLAPDHWLISGRAVVKTARQTTEVFSGSAAGRSSAECMRRAGAEILERMYATPQFCTPPADGFELRSLNGTPTGRTAAPSEVLIRLQGGSGASPRVSASGLAIHPSLRRAVSHAVREILERHLLCDWWYRRRRLSRVATERLDGEFDLHLCTTAEASGFALAVVTGRTNPVFFCGSAVKRSLQQALDSARLEALALLTNLPHLSHVEERERFPGDSAPRLKSLVGDNAQRKIRHFENSVAQGKRLARDHVSLRDSLAACGVSPHNVSFTEVNRIGNLVLVRAFVEGLLTKNSCRKSFTDVEPDPFC